MIATLSQPLVYPTLDDNYSYMSSEDNSKSANETVDSIGRTGQFVAIKANKTSPSRHAENNTTTLPNPNVKKVSFEADSALGDHLLPVINKDIQLLGNYPKCTQKPQQNLMQVIPNSKPDNLMTDISHTFLPPINSESVTTSDSHLYRLHSFIEPSSSMQSKCSSTSDSTLHTILYRSSFYSSVEASSVIEQKSINHL